ncbi:hypothetical protein EI94DRAFT_1725642 [Lactarius quietus]|nr:hypothetical protein EI94DRAFT_1725642 [Lactarius quietus]
MTWESYILRSFQAVPRDSSRYDFHGPYGKLLFSLFPVDSDFMVAPCFESEPVLIDYFRYEILFKYKKPVLIVDLKAPGDLQNASKRQEAIQRIQQRIKDLSPEYPLPVLHVAYRTQPNDPSFDLAEPKGLTELAPEELWNCDLFEEEGEQRFKAMVQEIKKACEAVSSARL